MRTRHRIENTQRRAELRFRTAFEDSPLGMALVGTDGRLLQANRRLGEIVGYSEARLMRMVLGTIVHPDDRDGLAAGMDRLLSGGIARLSLALRYLHAGGRVGWASIGMTLAGGVQGMPPCSVMHFDDISDQRRLEHLRSIPSAVARVLDSSTDAQGACEKTLQVVCEQAGWTAGELWLPDRRDGVLRLEAAWRAETPGSAKPEMPAPPPTCARGVGLPGRVWDCGAPVWIGDLAAESETSLAAARAAGLSTAAGLPVNCGGELGGVIALFRPEAGELDDVLLAALAPLGTLVGQFLRRRSAQIALQENVDYVGAVLGKVADGVITTDEGGVIESFNHAVEKLFGYEAAELQGAEVKTLLAEPYRAELVRFLGITLRPENPAATGADVREMWGRRKDGSTFPIDFRASRVLLGGRARLVGIVRDLSQQKTERETLQFMALHDPLTGLPNRTLFQDRLRQAILGGRRGRRALALMILDLDRFKEINDTLGHEAGDHLLRQVALGLGQVLRQSDTVARLGGDEFAVLLAGETKPQGAAETARKILETLGRPQEFRGRRIETAASVGIAMFPEHGEDAETLLRHADAAMYVAKRRRSGFAVYSPRQQEGRVARLELLQELGQAIVRDELVLHYQPRVDLKSGRTLGAEALVRWQHPRLGLIPPDQFLAAAEETEMIRPLTRWVLNQALRQFRVWADTGLVVDINVNVSARNLFDRDFSDMTLDLLGTWNVEPVRLELDVNESALTASSASGSIERLGALGVGLSIDDFGPGRASLAHLKGLPIRTIKIDKSLVSDSLNEGARVSALRPLIEMAHTMNLSIVAEGVESQEIWDRLAAIGCDSAQGYYVCPPIFAADLTEWLREPPRAWTHAARPG